MKSLSRAIKQILRTGILRLLWGIDFALGRFGFAGRGVAVLMYHSVSDRDWEFSIPPAVFDKHLRVLKERGYEFLAEERFLRIITGDEKLPAKSVLITFDDGYRDLLDEALPILRRHDVPAVVFVHADRSSRELGNVFSLLTWDEIRSLRGAGVAIGAHSYAHPSLKTLTPAALSSDFDMAADVFRRELGGVPEAFAYPGGKYSENVVHALREHGYRAAFSINEGLVRSGSDPYRLPRIGIVRGMPSWEFKAKLTRAAGWYDRLRRIL